MYNYTYLVFYGNDDRLPKSVPDGYQTLSLRDLEGVDGVHLIPYPLHHLPYFFRYIYFVLSHRRLKKIIPHSLIKLFYPFFFNKKFKSDKPLCFLLIDCCKLPVDYLKYVKSKYPNCKIVWFYRDLVCVGEKAYPGMAHNPLLDFEMTFDNGEAQKYGMVFCPEYSSLVDLPEHNMYPTCDVFFCGKAKDRYEKLISYYSYLTKKGLRCHFFIAEVPESKQLSADGLFYNRFMPYKEMLCRTANAKCLLDINQLEAYGGYTSRFYEAIMYNKKLITDNPITKESVFYNQNDIIFVTKPEDITNDYIINLGLTVNYHYNGEFSPLRMIETVEKQFAKNICDV